MATIEAGHTTLNATEFALLRLLKDLKEIFQLKANAKQLELILNCSPDIPQYIRTDEVKLRNSRFSEVFSQCLDFFSKQLLA